MKVSDSSIISESPHQQINNGLSQDQALQKYPWLRISGSGSCGQLATHCPSLSTTCTHSLFITPGQAVVELLGLTTTTTTTPSSRNGQVLLHQPAQSVQWPPFSCIPSQPSHFKDELIIHHTRNILSGEKQ